MKIKPSFFRDAFSKSGGALSNPSRKILRHEPLEDRHLLAVDLTNSFAGGMSSALSPQEELAAVSAPQTSTQLAPAVAANVNETALIPNDIAESENGSDETNINVTNLADQEANTTLQTEIAAAFCGPMTWREWLE